jgi:hypothetical protein
MVRVPVRPASDGNWFWNSMRIVGTSRTHTVPAAPNVNVSGRVVELVVVEPDGEVVEVEDGLVGPLVVVVEPGIVVEDVVVGVVVGVLVDVVVSSGGQFSGSVTTAVAVSPELA